MCAVLEIGTHLFLLVSNSVASKARTFQASQSQKSASCGFAFALALYYQRKFDEKRPSYGVLKMKGNSRVENSGVE